MDFRIADTFTGSLVRLTADEQKAVKMSAFDLQVNPAKPGLSLHRIDKAKDKHFWSARVSRDLRIIVHQTDAALLLCYVGHHDDAYSWAERRKIERHPKTGAAQLVEIRETVREIEIPRYVEAAVKGGRPQAATPLFARITDDELLGYGVPAEWLADVRAATEDSLLDLADHLPREAAEALLELATGSKPVPAPVAAAAADPFAHPDAQRRFRVMANLEELQQALEYPWEKWAVFLHPAQRDLVAKRHKGPSRVAGSAGTGKTVVAIHRAAHLARENPGAKVLLTTFSPSLAGALRLRLRALVGHQPDVHSRIDVKPIEDVGRMIYAQAHGQAHVLGDDEAREMLSESAGRLLGDRFPIRFVWDEWFHVVDAWQVDTWEQFRTVPRLGRKTRLSESQRRALWAVFEEVIDRLKAEGKVTHAGMFLAAAASLQRTSSPYQFAVVDECQDLTVTQLRLLAAMAGTRPDGLSFAGDLGQRIFQAPFSWKSLGVDVRGRSSTLRINYRTSHQIRRRADLLLGAELADVDGIAEGRRGTVSVFNGPEPVVLECESEADEARQVAQWISTLLERGMRPEEVVLIVRSDQQAERAKRAAAGAGVGVALVDASDGPVAGSVSVATMHAAKGLEFRAVAVMAIDEGVVPLEERLEAVTDEADLEEVYETERHLLYVACTRARDELLLAGVTPLSEFVGDFVRAGGH